MILNTTWYSSLVFYECKLDNIALHKKDYKKIYTGNKICIGGTQISKHLKPGGYYSVDWTNGLTY